MRFLGAAHFDEDIEIAIRAARFGTKSMEVAAAIFHGDALLNVGKLNYVYVSPGTTQSAVAGRIHRPRDGVRARHAVAEVIGVILCLQRSAGAPHCARDDAK